MEFYDRYLKFVFILIIWLDSLLISERIKILIMKISFKISKIYMNLNSYFLFKDFMISSYNPIWNIKCNYKYMISIFLLPSFLIPNFIKIENNFDKF